MKRDSSVNVLRVGAFLALGGLVLVGACYDVGRVAGPPLGYETNVHSCSDGQDNDFDGFVDCLDPDCIARNFCGEIIPFNPPNPFEGSVATCTDGLDNDDNGQFDCGDRKCQGVQETCCVTEFTDAACSDGIDNDGNGFGDCEDFACRNGTFTTVCNAELICDDGVDNDADDFVDCDDRDCASTSICLEDPGPENTVARCTDGVDNDGNGFTDCREFGCCPMGMGCIDIEVDNYCANLPTEDTVEACTDGIDNDGNGFSDCGEFGCCRSGICPLPEVQLHCDNMPQENTFELCTDGIDNDGNGFLDCNDNSCSQSDDPDLKRLCEADYDSCTDFIDNDGDGFLDCSDRSCEGLVELRNIDPDTVRRLSPCLESVYRPEDVDPRDMNFTEDALRAIAIVGCSDGFDGDADNIIDCEDWDCQFNPLLNPRTNNPESTEFGFCEGATYNPSTGRWEGGSADTRTLHCQ